MRNYYESKLKDFETEEEKELQVERDKRQKLENDIKNAQLEVRSELALLSGESRLELENLIQKNQKDLTSISDQ
jgi:Spy/CpxP family protein refolding chaperone